MVQGVKGLGPAVGRLSLGYFVGRSVCRSVGPLTGLLGSWLVGWAVGWAVSHFSCRSIALGGQSQSVGQSLSVDRPVGRSQTLGRSVGR